MRERIRRIIHNTVPEPMLRAAQDFRKKQHDAKHLAEISKYFGEHEEEALAYSKELEFLKSERILHGIPYPFSKGYAKLPVSIKKDLSNGLRYVIHNGKRLYFPKNHTKYMISKAYRDLLKEQDSLSPHRYISESIDKRIRSDTKNGKSKPEYSLLDVGCAEGILTLDLIDCIKKAYLFEYDDRWIEALKATFAPWSEKVEIIHKYASNLIDEEHTTLDAVSSGLSGGIMVKIDVEGAEKEVLEGAGKLLKRDNTIFLCCTYHRQYDAEQFEHLFEEHCFNTELTSGYMLWPYGNPMIAPFFRKGLLRCWKDVHNLPLL